MSVKYMARKVQRFFVHRVLSLDDTPHRIALGVAVGIFVAWTPTLGFQMVLTIAMAALLRANKFVGVPFVWISNPATLVPVYLPNYLVGSWLLGGRHTTHPFMRAMREAMHNHSGWWEATKAWWQAILDIFWPLWLGSLVVGLLLGAAAYGLVYYGVIAFRREREKLLLRHGLSKPQEPSSQAD